MAKYPIFLEMRGRRVVIVGAGAVAFRKAQILLDAGARLTIVAEHAEPAVEILCQKNKQAELVKSPYSKEYLNGATLAIAATNNRELNKQIFHDCQSCDVLCNVVDDPELCDFFAPAVLRRGDLQIAISTDGICPAYAGHIRKKLEEMFTETHAQFLAELECMRIKVIHDIPDADGRKTVMGTLADDESLGVFTADADNWRRYADEIISRHTAPDS
ncbi:MAG: bifunctional precorrin-2 dehydrogenase/sirohydrochlorin ferrochelatase [Sedimentisphaerales bacterium]|nr:bifunctional precorrin-2 dehydrogenase/sirohydrochlorin ferrochelatase [Sedimentisphaerales bacterium]